MLGKVARKRWVYILIFFCFMMFHHLDIIMLDPMRSEIEAAFNISAGQSQTTLILSLVTAGVFFLLWGYVFDRHSRRNFLVLAGFLWGATSWLTGIAPTFETFALSFSAGTIDNASITGILSLVGDYFSPRDRGKIFGVLFTAQPVAYLVLLVFFSFFFTEISWRTYLFFSGGVGIVLSVIIYLKVREPNRGQSEPALMGMKLSGQYLFDWESARATLLQPGFLMLCGLSLFSVMPLAALYRWVTTCLSMNQGGVSENVYQVLFPILIALILGNPLGGLLGDILFQLKKRARVWVTLAALALALVTSVMMFLAGDMASLSFRIWATLTGLLISMARPNTFAMVFDITLPEIRTMSVSVLMVFQLIGLGLGSLLVKSLGPGLDIHATLFIVTVVSILLSLLLLIGLLSRMPKEIENLRRHMAYRSQLEARLESRK